MFFGAGISTEGFFAVASPDSPAKLLGLVGIARHPPNHRGGVGTVAIVVSSDFPFAVRRMLWIVFSLASEVWTT